MSTKIDTAYLDRIDREYYDYLARHRPWRTSSTPAWHYYYRPWHYYPFRSSYYYDKYYDKYKYYDPVYCSDYWYHYYKYKHLYRDSSAVEDYLKSLDKMDNLRDSIHSLKHDLEMRQIKDDLDRSRQELEEDLERSYRLQLLDSSRKVWSDPRPRPLSAISDPYEDHLSSLRLRNLRLEEKRLLEIRRLQELERLRGPQPKWYELKTPQFHKEARKNNEILAAKRQWGSLRNHTESVWRSRDLSRSSSCL